ncbi:MAG: lipopolysaccharide biosynthesis protein [Salibacteraceae bacterium]
MTASNNGGLHSRINLISNIKYSFLVKFIHILTNLYLVKIAIDLSGESNYGLWLTFLSIFTWFSCIDVGLNNSFRRELTKAFDSKNNPLFNRITGQMFSQSLVHYLFVLVIVSGVVVLFPIESFFSNQHTMEKWEFKSLLLVCFGIYFGHFVLFTTNSILLSIHKAKESFFWLFFQSGITLIILFSFKFSSSNLNLVEICLSFSIGPLLSWLTATFYYKKKLNFSVWETKEGKVWYSRILKSTKTNQFFLIQLATLTFFSADNLIIMKLISASEVASYQVAFKYFNIIIVAFNIVLVPFWSAFSSADHNDSQHWISKKLKQLIALWFLFVLGAVAMLYISNTIYNLWIGNNFSVSMWLNIAAALFILQIIWNTIFSNYLNSIEKVKSQMTFLIIGSILNIPLSIYFGKLYGASGIILTTCFCLLPLSIIMPIESFRSISKKKESLEGV